MLLPSVMLSLRRVVPALFLAVTTQAATVVVTVQRPEGVALQPVTVVAAQVTDHGLSAERQIPVPANSPTSVELPSTPGRVWQLAIRAPGLWSEPQTVSLTDQPLSVRFELLPSSRVHGTVAAAEDGPKVTSLEIGFQVESKPPRVAHVECPVGVNGAWTCELPAGTVDLRLKSRGYMAQYRWNAKLPAGGETDLGALTLKRGASVVGRVEIDERNTPLEATVHLQQQPAPGAGYVKSETVRALALTATVNAKGFFAFDGVPPGSYVVNATQKGYATEPREVRVLANVEAELSRPLRLMKLQGVLITVTPPVDAGGKPWRLRLRPAEANVVPAEAAVDATGAREFRGVPPGKYRLTVLAADGSAWAARGLDVTPATPPLVVELGLVHLSGRVVLGEKPLAAEVWFGGAHGAVSIPMQSGADGAFEGDLPTGGIWPVQIASEHPRVRAMLQKVEVKAVEARASVSLELPGTALGGTAMSEDSVPIANAIVTAKTDDSTLQEFTAEDGSFRFDGLPAGSIQLSASSAGTLMSDPMTVALEEKHPSEGLRLVLHEASFLRGRVTSAAGGVPGAVVYAFSLGDPSPTIVPTPCNESGDFRARLNAGATEAAVIVTAPGFSLRAMRVPLGKGPVLVPVEQNGGRLEIDFDPKEGAFPLILEDGIPIHFGILAAWARATGGAVSSTHLAVDGMAPGNYSVCGGGLAALSNCHAGVLAPLGQLKIAAAR